MFLLDLLFPKYCLGCGKLGAYICIKCADHLKYIQKDICVYCKRPSLYGLTHPLCKKRHGLDGCISFFYYNNLLKKVIKNIKYRHAVCIWSEFYKLIKPDLLYRTKFFTSVTPLSTLSPIPLHKDRLKERGFNQAELIAHFLETFLNISVHNYLKRSRYTNSQAQLQATDQRKKNIKNAFEAVQDVPADITIILVDDVITSGSTILEAATVLKKERAQKVFAITLARG